MEYNDDQIKHILNVYKTQREKDKEIYLKRKQDPIGKDPESIMKKTRIIGDVIIKKIKNYKDQNVLIIIILKIIILKNLRRNFQIDLKC